MRSGYTFLPMALLSPGGAEDRLIDPVSGDYLDDEEGAWVDTDDSRTTVLIAFSTELNRSPYNPSDGTSTQQRRDSGIPITPEFLEAESSRVGRSLQRSGILSGFTASARDDNGEPLSDEAGRVVVKTSWRDLRSRQSSITLAP